MFRERKPPFGSHNNETESKMANYSTILPQPQKKPNSGSSAVQRGMGDYHEIELKHIHYFPM
jgi:hypothetical protein